MSSSRLQGRYGLWGVVLLLILGSNLGGVGPERGLRAGGRRGWCEEWAGAARTILLFLIISARPSKQPLMVRTFLKVYMELGSYFLFLQEQIKDIIINGTCMREDGARGQWPSDQLLFEWGAWKWIFLFCPLFSLVLSGFVSS